MTDPLGASATRRIACSGCGTEFGCSPGSSCWCAEETVRMPMPVESADCLCRDCLHKAAARVTAAPAT
jgi:hypothetical protein